MKKLYQKKIISSLKILVISTIIIHLGVIGCMSNSMLHSARVLPAKEFKLGLGSEFSIHENLSTTTTDPTSKNMEGVFVIGRVGLGSSLELGLEYVLPYTGASLDVMWQMVGDRESFFSLALDLDFSYMNQQQFANSSYEQFSFDNKHYTDPLLGQPEPESTVEYFYNMIDTSPAIVSTIHPAKWLDIYFAVKGIYRYEQVEQYVHVGGTNQHTKNFSELHSILIGPLTGIQLDLFDAFSWEQGLFLAMEAQYLWRIGGSNLPFEDPQTHFIVSVGAGIHY